MKILIVLTYFRPHISGLTIYADRLARAFATRGHQVTVLTSRFRPDLPAEEFEDGVRIVRAPVLFRISKGVIMPTFGLLASKLVSEHDVIQLHLPQFDAAGVAMRGRLLKKPTLITYHCDLELPPGWFNRVANAMVLAMNDLAAAFTHRIVSYTKDYAEHSPYARRFIGKVEIIPPPVTLPMASEQSIKEFGRLHNPRQQHPVIGMVARFATEKGVEVLLGALPEILKQYPKALVQFVGPYQNIIGEEEYLRRLEPEIGKYQQTGNWVFLGPRSQADVAAFFPNLDVFVVPSLNSTESFGLVQIESMMNGVPCVTSDLPGVRQPVLMHGMGKIFRIGDSHDLAEKILEILENAVFYRSLEPDLTCYSPEAVAEKYEELFSVIATNLKKS